MVSMSSSQGVAVDEDDVGKVVSRAGPFPAPPGDPYLISPPAQARRRKRAEQGLLGREAEDKRLT